MKPSIDFEKLSEKYKNIYVTDTFIRKNFGKYNMLELFFNFKGDADNSVDLLYKIIARGNGYHDDRIHSLKILDQSKDMYKRIQRFSSVVNHIGPLRRVFNNFINDRLYVFENLGIRKDLVFLEDTPLYNAILNLKVKPYMRREFGRIDYFESFARITLHNDGASMLLSDPSDPSNPKKIDVYMGLWNDAVEGAVPQNTGFSIFHPKVAKKPKDI